MENQVTNNNDEIEIDLGEIFHLILSRLGVIILSGIILGVISHYRNNAFYHSTV